MIVKYDMTTTVISTHATKVQNYINLVMELQSSANSLTARLCCCQCISVWEFSSISLGPIKLKSDALRGSGVCPCIEVNGNSS